MINLLIKAECRVAGVGSLLLAIFAILALINKMWLQLGIFALIFAAGVVRYMRREGTTGGARCPVDIGFAPTGAKRRPIAGRGGRNLYRYGSQGTARGSRVQNREIEDGGYRALQRIEMSRNVL